ncbi:MAG: glycosyltransferase family 2 protein [Elusimicrobiota bacterium]|jgi:cellulose synthase/poly-beta-1,6-N-acetylglucosamine synthase-like glycosyltransferase
MISGIPIDILFIVSVLLIWFMLMYQFVLAFAGYLYSRESAREQVQLDDSNLDLPPLSILIPAHNEEIVIERTLKALLASDYPPDKIEVIVLNDGSTDRTAEIVERLAQQHPQIRPIHIPREEGGRGKAAVLNCGVKLARHSLIAIFDADNQPEPESLRYLAAQFVMEPTLGAALGKFRTQNRNRNLLTRFINIEGLSFQWIVQAGRWKLLKIATLPGTNFIVRKEVLQDVGLWDEEALTEDAELSLRILEAGFRIKFVPYAVTWEQEPEDLHTWFQQRTRWARGSFYLMRKFLAGIETAKNKALALEVFYFLCLYYVFVLAIVSSGLLFILGLFGLIFIPVPGPYLEVWLMAYLLFVTEIVLMLLREPEEDSISNIFYTMAMYFTYCQLWPFVVANAFYLEFIKGEKRTWVKTKRFKTSAV